MTGLKLSWMQTVFSAISKVVTEWPASLYLPLCRVTLWATFPIKCCTSLCNVFCKGDKSRGTKKVNSQRPEVNKWRTSQCSHLLLINYTIMWKPTCAASLFILPHDKECWMSYFATGFFSHQNRETAEWNRREISVRKHTLHFRNADAICPEGSGTKEKEIKKINARLWVRSNSQNTYEQVMEFPLTGSCVYSVEHGPSRHYRDHTAYRTRGRKGSVQSLYKLTPNIFSQSLQTRTK